MSAPHPPSPARTKRMPDGWAVATRALAYRVWSTAQPLGWDVTIEELAHTLGVPVGRIRRVVQLSGWRTQLRTSQTDRMDYPGMISNVDEALESMGAR